MRILVFVPILYCCSLAIAGVVPSGPKLQRPKFDEPWLEVLAQQIGAAVQERFEQLNIGEGGLGIKDSDLPDPWNFPNATHRMLALFQDGEIKTFNPKIYGLSKLQVLHFTFNVATDTAEFALRVPTMTWQGEYNLWIDKYTSIGVSERRRGNGHYSHTFRNVDYVSTFKLHTHPSGRITVQDMTSSISFERCDVWSENYTINSYPITNWEGVSVTWKERFDHSWGIVRVVVEEVLESFYGSIFGFYQLPKEGIVNLIRDWGAEIIIEN